MKYFPKMRAIEALRIKSIESVGDVAVLVLENGDKEQLKAEMVIRYLPVVGDYLVINSDSSKDILPRLEFESLYQSVETIKAKCVSMDDIANKVATESFAVNGNMTVAFLGLDNKFMLSGSSFCVEDEDFHEGLGRGIAFRNAVEKCYEYESYHRMQLAHDVETACEKYDTERAEND